MPISPTYPGVYIQEIPSGVRTITGVSTSVAAFIGAAKRGPINVATHVFSASDFDRTFGGLDASSEMSYAVRQFFLNGGSEAWVVRVATNVVNASDTLLSATAAQVLDLTAVDGGKAGNNIQVTVDYQTSNPASTFNLTLKYQSPDSPADQLVEQFANLSMNSADGRFVEAVVTGTSALVTAKRHAGLAISGTGTSTGGAVTDISGLNAQHNQIQVVVDGLPAVAVILAPADIAGGLTGIAAAIQAQVRAGSSDAATKTSFKAVVGGAGSNQLVLTSGSTGETSSVRVLAGARNDATAILKLGALNGGVEQDAAAAFRPKPVPVSAALTGAAIGAGNITGLPSAAADRFQISLDGNGPDTVVPGGPAIAAGTLATQLADMAARIQAKVRALRPAVPAYKNFTAAVAGSGDRLVLTSGSAGSGSSVTVSAGLATDLASGLGLLTGTSTHPLNEALSAGNDDPYNASTIYSAFVPSPSSRGGIYALESVDIFNLMVLAGVTDSSTLIDAAAYCASRRAFLIVDSDPTAATPDKLATLVQGAGVPKTSSAAIYGPWIKIGDPLNGGKLRKTAPSGSLAGLYARTDSSRGVWKAPAGTEANILGAQGLDYVLTDGENGSLNPLGFNALRLFPVYGVVSWGARTLLGADAAASEYKYVPVRRLALYLEESLYRGTKWVVFEPNDEPLWAQIRLNIGAFMQTLFRQGAFQGQTPSQAYFVKCDSETTTQNDINLGIVNIVVGFAPLKPAEFVIIQLQQMAGQIAV